MLSFRRENAGQQRCPAHYTGGQISELSAVDWTIVCVREGRYFRLYSSPYQP